MSIEADPAAIEEEISAKPDLRLIAWMHGAGLVACCIGLAISLNIVIAYFFDLPWKIGFRVTPTSIALLIGSSLLMFHLTRDRASVALNVIRLFSALTTIVSLLTLIEYLSGQSMGVDLPFLGVSVGSPFDSPHARMSPNSALAFFLIGLSVCVQSFTHRFQRTAQMSAVLAAAVAMLALIGYAYDVGHLYSFAGLAAMSLLGAVSFLLLSFSALVIRPTTGILKLVTSSRAGGSTARKLFLAVLIVPPLLGFLSLRGYVAGSYDTPFGISLVVIMSMMIFAVLTSVVAVRLENADARRSEVEVELSTSREELRELSMHVQAVQEEERIRIAREIHDELGNRSRHLRWMYPSSRAIRLKKMRNCAGGWMG